MKEIIKLDIKHPIFPFAYKFGLTIRLSKDILREFTRISAKVGCLHSRNPFYDAFDTYEAYATGVDLYDLVAEQIEDQTDDLIIIDDHKILIDMVRGFPKGKQFLILAGKLYAFEMTKKLLK